MKKIIILGLSLLLTAVAAAQTNPQRGYVITNNGDTIRGVIDFRTNERMSKQCDFWADGGGEGKTYKPGDIEGFRFDNNGKYFVTRRLNLDGEPQLYFAEFMVQGKMNLYCVADKYNEHFFFEREDGAAYQQVIDFLIIPPRCPGPSKGGEDAIRKSEVPAAGLAGCH